MGHRVAVIGGGWAGLAAAIEAVRLGHQVVLYEMAGQLGGRARRVTHGDWVLDNGQHILIGAYTESLQLMRSVGVDIDTVLWRTPLCLVRPDGVGLHLMPGPPLLSFLRAVLSHKGWTWSDRISLLKAAIGWQIRRFDCGDALTVAQLAKPLSAAVNSDLIEPLCIAALNTPAHEASSRVFLRVLRDALQAGAGSADLLLPRQPLSSLLPEPARKWLLAHGAQIRLSTRVVSIEPEAQVWRVDGTPYARAVLATTASEAARLAASIAPLWSDRTRGLQQEPIITVYVNWPGMRCAQPMLTLPSDADEQPAQFVFDHGQLSGRDGLLAFVISGAQAWVDRGSQAVAEAVLRQGQKALGNGAFGSPSLVSVISEKRATFRCTPGLRRPAALIAPGLVAAGDYVDGPYPATLEAAVRSGLDAARLLH